jgi:hypothetical protein
MTAEAETVALLTSDEAATLLRCSGQDAPAHDDHDPAFPVSSSSLSSSSRSE